MIIDDLWDSHGPSASDLKVLERLGRHRRAFEALEPAGEHQTTVRERLLSLLDVMEETVCEEGRSAPSLAEAWQQIDELEKRYWEGEATAGEAAAAAPPPSAFRPEPAVPGAVSASPEDAAAPLAANQPVRPPKAA